MSLLLRSALGPLALTLLLALQVIAVPEVSAGRATKVSKTTQLRGGAARQRTKMAPRRQAGKRSVARPLRTLRSIKSSKAPAKAKARVGAEANARVKANVRVKAKARVKANVRVRATPARLAKQKRLRAELRTSTAAKPRRFQKSINAVKAGFAAFKSKPAVVRAIKYYTKVTARVTRTLDAWQARGPPWLAKTMSGLRTYTLPSIASYTFSKVKNDKLFLGTYFASNSIISNIILPASIVFGMDPVLSGVLNALSTPLTMGVVVLRERHNRRKAGENVSIGESTGIIVKEYKDFAKARRAESSAAAKALALADR